MNVDEAQELVNQFRDTSNMLVQQLHDMATRMEAVASRMDSAAEKMRSAAGTMMMANLR